MSQAYGMSVLIEGYDKAKCEAIRQAAAHEWPGLFDWTFDGGPGAIGSGMRSYGESQLCGGETEEEFADRLAVAIWAANGGFCEVTVDATYLESLPYESYCLDEDDFERLMHQQNKE